MKMIMKKYISILAAMAALMSCQKEGIDTSFPTGDEISFEFGMPSTKATASGFESGDQVSVYAVEYAGSQAPELQIAGNFLNNEKLTFNGSKWTAAHQLYWSSKPCDFYAIYPYQDLVSVEEHPFKVATDQNAIVSEYEIEDEGNVPDFVINGVNKGPGIQIDDLIWAPVNSGTYVSYWEAMEVCPEGWRMPTKEEFLSLAAHRSKFSNGCYFSGSVPFNSNVDKIWFDANGRELHGEDAEKTKIYYRNSIGFYWTSERVGPLGANTFRFSKDGVSTEGLNIAEYYCSARCVREADKNTPTGNLDGYEASDLLWAKAEDVEKKDGSVKLQFKHMMSKCVVKVVKGEKFEGEIPNDIVCQLYNTVTSAKLDFTHGSVEKDAMGERKTITMKKLSNTRFEAVLVPQNIENRTPLVAVTMGGIAYLLEYSLSFKPGHVHTINLILNTSPDQEKIDISIDAETGGWE